MSKFSDEQLRHIIDGAKKVDKPSGLEVTEWLTNGDYVVPTWQEQVKREPQAHNLSDMKEILALRERIQELEDNIGMALSHNSMSYLLRAPKENTNERD